MQQTPSTCPPGQRLLNAGSKTVQQACAVCAAGTYKVGTNAGSVCTRQTTTACSAGQ